MPSSLEGQPLLLWYQFSMICQICLKQMTVQIIALDFSKAFDTVRHCTLMQKLALLPIPDFLYNWLENYLLGRVHCTKSLQKLSAAKSINASVVQGSAIGPVAFIVNAMDLKIITPGNQTNKYTHDTYLLVPSRNKSTVAAELDSIAEWAKTNNLCLNKKEIAGDGGKQKQTTSSYIAPDNSRGGKSKLHQYSRSHYAAAFRL